MTIRPTPTTEAVRETLTTEPSEEAQARHLAAIRDAARDDFEQFTAQALGNQASRILQLEAFKAQAEFQIMNLTQQMQAVIESQKSEDTEVLIAKQRSILALALSEVMADNEFLPHLVDEITDASWRVWCAEVYRRYGGPEFGLWLNPPDHVSDKTKQLVKLFLQRRQEA